MSFLDFFKGFVVTGKLPFKPKVTVLYPEEKRPKPERFHGRHVLNRYEDGMEKCIGCELCAGVCPARCIYVRGADNPPDAPVSPGERYGFVYEINFLRCIHCDMCVEACPTEAITESKLFEWSFVNREDAIYTKAELLVDDEGRPQELPWEDWKPGDDRNTSAWVRATSPGGRSRHGRPAAVVRRARLRRAARPERPERSRPRPTSPADTDLSLREMVSGALRGIGVDGTRPVAGHGPTGSRLMLAATGAAGQRGQLRSATWPTRRRGPCSPPARRSSWPAPSASSCCATRSTAP